MNTKKGNSYGVGAPDVYLVPPVKTEGYLQVVPLGQVVLRKIRGEATP
jgi:hypothetical protein